MQSDEKGLLAQTDLSPVQRYSSLDYKDAYGYAPSRGYGRSQPPTADFPSLDKLPEAHAGLGDHRRYHTRDESSDPALYSMKSRSRATPMFCTVVSSWGIVGRQLLKADEAVPKAGLLKAR